MAPDHQVTTSTWRWQPRRKVPSFLRRRKAATVRLGGKRKKGRMVVVVRMLRKIRLKFLVMKLREYYRKVVKDLIEAGPTIQSFHHKLFVETSLGFPAASYPGYLRPPPTLFIV